MTRDLPRAIPLENASNLRDLGGWPAADGRRVRFGAVYRAPALVNLSAADEVAVASLGIKVACDLRGVRESAAAPVMLGAARVEKLPIEPSVGGSLRDILRTGLATGHVSGDEMLDLLREAYQAYALASTARYRTLFDLLRDAENLPLLFHCSAGKDRTGFGAALLLTALGVAWEHVVQDYLATNALWRRETARLLDLPDAVREALLAANVMLLEAAFGAVRGAYGSVRNYLNEAMGLDDTALSALKDRLLTD